MGGIQGFNIGLHRAYTGITGIIWGVYRVIIWDCIGVIRDYGDYIGNILG